MTSKPTNPKDILGSEKVPLHLWPETATVFGSLALLDGALKYGRANWRVAGVRASIYADALRRHVNRWFEGEDDDADSGLPHLAHALACLGILVDAKAAGKLTDDRNFPGGYSNQIDDMTGHVARLKEKYSAESPTHYHAGTATGPAVFTGPAQIIRQEAKSEEPSPQALAVITDTAWTRLKQTANVKGFVSACFCSQACRTILLECVTGGNYADRNIEQLDKLAVDLVTTLDKGDGE